MTLRSLSLSLGMVLVSVAVAGAGCTSAPTTTKKDGGSGGSSGSSGSGGKGGSSGSGGSGSDAPKEAGIGGSGGGGGAPDGSGKPGSNTMSCGDLYKCLVDMKCMDDTCNMGCVTSTMASDAAVMLFNDWNQCLSDECCTASTPCGDMCMDKTKTCTKECGQCFFKAQCGGAVAPGHCSKDTTQTCMAPADCKGGMGDTCTNHPVESMAKCSPKVAACFGVAVGDLNCIVPDQSKSTCGGGGP